MKRKPTEWEKIFTNDVTDKENNFQNIQTSHTTQNKKEKKDTQTSQ